MIWYPPTKAEVAQGLKCIDCRHPVRKNGLQTPDGPLCGKCLTTPWEIRQRQIYGCVSLNFIETYELDKAKYERAQHAREMASAAPSTHRKRFISLDGGKEPA